MIAAVFALAASLAAPDALRLEYGAPAPTVDLGAGLWGNPLPLDWDRDGDLDLLVSCVDRPYNGMWYFENPGGGPYPVFKAARRVGPGIKDAQVSYVDGEARVLAQHLEYVNFRRNGFTRTRRLCDPALLPIPEGRVRAKDWRIVDFDADGDRDLVAGLDLWGDYGWDDGYDVQGRWVSGPLRGQVYLIERTRPHLRRYRDAVRLEATGAALETYGKPTPNLADFDGDGDLDLLCGEFVDTFTYFENTGTRTAPQYAPGRTLAREGAPIRMDLCMIVPTAVDWDADGDTDLIVGDEDGRMAWLEHTGAVAEGMPQFNPPRYFLQEGGPLKFGALATPHAVDWDGDGDEDLLCGNTAGRIAFIENLDGGLPPRWAPPQLMRSDGQPIRIRAGENGSIQGPAERKWGYTVITTADWDGDGLRDLIANNIWGHVVWYRNAGAPGGLDFDVVRTVRVQWDGAPPKPAWLWWQPAPHDLATQWRTTPFAIDWNRDGIPDLVMLDHEGCLALFAGTRGAHETVLLPGRRIFCDAGGAPLRLNARERGGSGRRKFCLADWDADGRVDLLLNSASANLWRNLGEDAAGNTRFEDRGPVTDAHLEGHDTCPTAGDWNRDGALELVIGAEDGHFYYVPR